MAHQNLSAAGIATGQIVQAPEITQFVNAFTGQPVNNQGYDITISGSLNLTGSLLMTGSFISEYKGQFKTLGLGVTAPSEPTMLHLKTADVSNDPLILIESDNTSGDAMILAKNPDTQWRYGLSGANTDSFMVIENKGGINYFPFNIGTTTPSYAFQIFNNVVGVGMGAGFVGNPSNLPPKSIQAFATVSGSLVEGQIISASSNTVGEVTIHGTASDASYAQEAATVASVNLGSVVMTGTNTATFSGSGNFNSIYNIVSNGGRVEGTNLRYKTGVQDTNGENIIKGNISSNTLKIGDPDAGGASSDGPIIEFDTTNNKTLFKTDNQSTNDVHVFGSITSSEDIRISGSSTPALIVGPPTGLPVSNNPSSSLFHESLRFYKSGVTTIGNYNTDSSAFLNLEVGGDPNLQLSSSNETTVVKSLIQASRLDTNYTTNAAKAPLSQLGQFYVQMGGSDTRGNVVREYVLPSCFRAQGTASQVRFKYSPGATINATTVGSLVIVVDYNINFMGTNSSKVGFYKQQRVYVKNDGTNGSIVFKYATIIDEYQSGVVVTDPEWSITTSNLEDFITLTLHSPSIGGTIGYGGSIKITQTSHKVNPAVTF